MEISIMCFSMIPEALDGRINAGSLCRLLRESGISHLDLIDVEVPMYGEAALQKAMAENGIQVDCLIANVSFFRESWKAEEQLTTALQQAKRLGATILMVVPGNAEDAEYCSGFTREQILEQTVAQYQKAVELAADYNIQIGFENTPQYFKPLASAEDCLYILERVPGLGFVYDTANMKVANVDDDEVAYYEKLKPYIIRVHLKDVVIGPEGKMEPCLNGQRLSTVLLGSGSIRIREVLQKLHEDGYTGGIVMEYMAENISGDGHINMLRACCQYVRDAWEGQWLLPPYSIIPGLEKPVSRLFFGTAIVPMLAGGNTNTLLDAVFAQGINSFDCARGYCLAEKSLGNWIKDRGIREEVVVLTKCGNVDDQGVNVNRQVIETELAISLEMLQTDYVDVLLLHRDDPKTPVSEIIDTLNECVDQGKIRVFGASNWTHKRIQEANAYAFAHGLRGFSVASPYYGLAEQVEDPWGGECVTISGDANQDARQWYAKMQMPVLAYSSLGRGFFSGKFKSFDEDGARKVLDEAAVKGYLHPCNMERLSRAEQLAEELGCSVAQVAMRYFFAGPMNVFALVSTTNPNRMQENILAACNPLSEEQMLWLEHGKTE